MLFSFNTLYFRGFSDQFELTLYLSKPAGTADP